MTASQIKTLAFLFLATIATHFYLHAWQEQDAEAFKLQLQKAKYERVKQCP